MAEQGRREVVPDQLAFNAREQAPERTLATIGIRNPGMTGGPARSASRAMEGLYNALGGVADAVNDGMIVNGKMTWMQGMSEKEALDTGGHFGQQGWQAMDVVDKGNTWYLGKVDGLSNGDDAIDPQEYKKRLMDEYQQTAGNMTDPVIRKMFVASFEDKAPDLIAKQYQAHMAYNQGQSYNKLSNALGSSSAANADATRVMPGSTFRVSPSRIDTAIMGDASDRDNGILTILGEAAGEGDNGMAAVAHVIKNRVTDKRWGGSVTNVVRAAKQFSVWNDGGSTLGKFKGTAAYERAGMIYDAVMSGHTSDMTNGATHYYSPAGMKKLVADGSQGNLEPGWLSAETARSGGGIKIGGHIFAGKSGMAGYTPKYEQDPATGEPTEVPQAQGELIFAHKGQDKLLAPFAAILKESAAAMGMPYKITSGYRDPTHPVEAAKKSGPGEHSHGGAVDIDLSGMSDEQRTAVITDLRSRGVKRFGLYTNEPNMLHVDQNMKGGTPDDYFMYDKSKNNMGNAPKWYQEIAQSDAGVPLPKGDQPQVRTLLQNSGLPPHLQASALVDAMRRQLAEGSDQLWNDVGGVGLLYDLGAKPAEIDEAQRAHDAFEKKSLDGYDTAFERERSDFMTRVKAGEFGSKDDLISAVDKMYAGKRMNGSQAQSLVRAAQAEWDQVRSGEDAVLPKEFMDVTASVYRKVDGGLLTVDEGYAEIAAKGSSLGVDPKTSQRFLQKVYSVDEAKYARDRSEGETLRKKKLKDDDLKARSLSALAGGKGGANIPDGSVEVNGQTMTTKEFAIESLKDSVKTTIQNGIASGKIDGTDEDKVTGLFYKTLYATLAHNDIVDEKGGAAFTASLRGDITEKRDGVIHVRKDALQAFDTYLTMSSDPDISASYTARMFPDDKVRGLLEQSKKFYANNLDLETAMLNAQTVIANGNDPQKITHEYYSKVEAGVDDAIKKAIGNDSWWRGILPPFPAIQPVSSDYEKNLLTNERAKAATYIRSRADAYNAMQPGQDPSVSIDMAMQDFQNDMVQVRGQMIIGDHKRGTRIDQVMFTDAPNGQSGGKPLSYDKIAVQDAINNVIERQGKEFWPQWWLQGDDSRRPPTGANSLAPVNVTYNPTLGIVGLQMHDKKGKPLGDTVYLSAKEIGDTYRYDYLDKPGTLGKLYDTVMDTSARSLKKIPSIMEGIDAGWRAVR